MGSCRTIIYCGKYISPVIYLRFHIYYLLSEVLLPCYFCLKPQPNRLSTEQHCRTIRSKVVHKAWFFRRCTRKADAPTQRLFVRPSPVSPGDLHTATQWMRRCQPFYFSAPPVLWPGVYAPISNLCLHKTAEHSTHLLQSPWRSVGFKLGTNCFLYYFYCVLSLLCPSYPVLSLPLLVDATTLPHHWAEPLGTEGEVSLAFCHFVGRPIRDGRTASLQRTAGCVSCLQWHEWATKGCWGKWSYVGTDRNWAGLVTKGARGEMRSGDAGGWKERGVWEAGSWALGTAHRKREAAPAPVAPPAGNGRAAPCCSQAALRPWNITLLLLSSQRCRISNRSSFGHAEKDTRTDSAECRFPTAQVNWLPVPKMQQAGSWQHQRCTCQMQAFPTALWQVRYFL